MKRSPLFALVIAIAIAALGVAQSSSPAPSDPVLVGCQVKIDDNVPLSAREPGVLVHLAVDEGDLVRSGDQIGKVDDSEPQMQRKVALYGRDAAVKRATDDVEIRFQVEAAGVLKADYGRLQEANRRTPGSITVSEMQKGELEWKKAVLGIEKTKHDQELAKFEAYAKQAELEAAELAIARRAIIAPFDGEVVTVYRHQDEWVNPGDPILRLVRLDTMEVEGQVDQSEYDPHEIQGCEVTVEVRMARERSETVRGRINYVSSLVGGHGKYVVKAEVPNRKEHGRWMLRDGLNATMTIHLNTGGIAAAAADAAP